MKKEVTACSLELSTVSEMNPNNQTEVDTLTLFTIFTNYSTNAGFKQVNVMVKFEMSDGDGQLVTRLRPFRRSTDHHKQKPYIRRQDKERTYLSNITQIRKQLY